MIIIDNNLLYLKALNSIVSIKFRIVNFNNKLDKMLYIKNKLLKKNEMSHRSKQKK